MEVENYFSSSNKINKFVSSLTKDENTAELLQIQIKTMPSTDQKNLLKNEQIDKPSNLQKLLQYGCLEMVEAPQKCVEKRNNFTIDYILGHHEKQNQTLNSMETQYDWLHYTRYRPPKLQRIRKKECVQKRRLGRNPRIPFSNEQVAILEEKFQISPYLSNSDVVELSGCLQLSESRIKIWFQNRRARERRDGNDSSEKGLNLIKSFLMKTRHSSSITEDVQDLSMSAFKPCQNSIK